MGAEAAEGQVRERGVRRYLYVTLGFSDEGQVRGGMGGWVVG